MKIFVLCGGKGTRLRPLTYETPKPMLKIRGKPLLQYLIEHLKKNGFKEFIFTVGYLKGEIIKYFSDGKKFGVHIEYAVEEEDDPKNTAGSISDYRGKVAGTFAVIMGDHLTTVDLNSMLESHRKSRCIATIALKRHDLRLEYGTAELDGNRLVGFEEKPVIKKYINTAIYLFEPEVFKYISEKDDFAKNVFPKMLNAGEKINAYLLEENWFDIGRLEDYKNAEKLLDKLNI